MQLLTNVKKDKQDANITSVSQDYVRQMFITGLHTKICTKVVEFNQTDILEIIETAVKAGTLIADEKRNLKKLNVDQKVEEIKQGGAQEEEADNKAEEIT